MADSPKTHHGEILPLSDAGERISRAFCHRRAPGHPATGLPPPTGGGLPAADGYLTTGGAVGCGRAPGHGRGLPAASWTTDSGTVCHEPPFNRKNKHHAENKNEPVHSNISPLLYGYRFYLLRNKYLALESTHL